MIKHIATGFVVTPRGKPSIIEESKKRLPDGIFRCNGQKLGSF